MLVVVADCGRWIAVNGTKLGRKTANGSVPMVSCNRRSQHTHYGASGEAAQVPIVGCVLLLGANLLRIRDCVCKDVVNALSLLWRQIGIAIDCSFDSGLQFLCRLHET